MAAAGGGDIEELVKRVVFHEGVEGFLILNSEGLCIRHSFSEASRPLAIQYAALFQNFSFKVNSVLQELDQCHHNNNNNNNNFSGSNELQLIRLRTKKDEIIIAPDNKYLLIVIQKPKNYSGEEDPTTTTETLQEGVA